MIEAHASRVLVLAVVPALWLMACSSRPAAAPAPIATAQAPLAISLDVPASTHSTTSSAVADVVLHYERSCARLVNGSVKCWGLVLDGRDDKIEPAPVAVPGLGDVVQLALGSTHACALLGSGRLRCWGSNEAGALGDGTQKDAAVAAVDPGLEGIAYVSVGQHFTCARRSPELGAETFCWGANQFGSLANGGTGAELRPKAAPSLAKAIEIALAGQHGLALFTDGSASYWGDNLHHQFGTPAGVSKTTPAKVPGLGGVAEVAASPSHSCARLVSGEVACWGANDVGQLGDGTTAHHDSPTAVPGLTGVTQIAVASRMSCARLSNATVRCWGGNDFGQLGDGTTTARDVPTTVPGLSNAKQIAVGGSHACAVLGDGSVQCWGSNLEGELGDHTRTSRAVRAPVIF